MDVKRYNLVKGIVTKEKEIIPIWDSRLHFEKTDLYGNIITYDNHRDHYHLKDIVFDLVTKKLSLGIDIDIYPTLNDKDREIGTVVLFEKNHSKNILTKIIDITYEDYDISICKGKKIEEWTKNKFPKDITIDKDTLYCIKTWKPMYHLDCGDKTDSYFYLKKIENLDYLSK